MDTFVVFDSSDNFCDSFVTYSEAERHCRGYLMSNPTNGPLHIYKHVVTASVELTVEMSAHE